MAWQELTPFGVFGRPPELQGGGVGGIAAALLQQRMQQQAQTQESLQRAGQTIAQMMEQKRRDDIANVIMDKYASDFGIDPSNNPLAGTGEQGLSAATQLIKLRMAQEEQASMADYRAAHADYYRQGGRGSVESGKIYDPELGIFITPAEARQREKERMKEFKEEHPETQYPRMLMSQLGITPEEVPTQGVKYYDKDKKLLSTEQATADPQSVAVLPDGQAMLASDWRSLMNYARSYDKLKSQLNPETPSGTASAKKVAGGQDAVDQAKETMAAEKGSGAEPTPPAGLLHANTQAEVDELPHDSRFIGPDGKVHYKP